jgi:hypothetical protein
MKILELLKVLHLVREYVLLFYLCLSYAKTNNNNKN